MSPLVLSITGTRIRSISRFLKDELISAHCILRCPLRELSLALVDDRRMGELHQRFMNIPGPTDVLTFPIDVAPDGRILSGEVVICVPEARRQAKARGIELKHELLLYALHGMLHLCGFDDRTERGFRRMHAKEDEILTRLGVGAVFHPHPPTTRRQQRGKPIRRRRAPRSPRRRGGARG